MSEKREYRHIRRETRIVFWETKEKNEGEARSLVLAKKQPLVKHSIASV